MSLSKKFKDWQYGKLDKTTAFKLYEAGKRYNNRLVPNYYQVVDTNTEFFSGNQWVHLKETPAMSSLPKPMFNILHRISSVLISQIASGGISVNLEPLSYYDGGAGSRDGINTTEFVQAEIMNLIEKLKLEYKLRKCLFDAAQTGDYCIHFWWNPEAMPYGGASGEYRGEICAERVDGVNVMFGNPNTPDVQSQPYIILIGRGLVKDLQYEYLQYHAGDSDGAMRITNDAEWMQQAASGGKIELDDEENAKCMYLYLYQKVQVEEDMCDRDGNPVFEDELDSDGNPMYEKDENDRYVMAEGRPVTKKKRVKHYVTHVHVSKMTRTQVIFDSEDTGLSLYPIAWGNWEEQKNCYHGRALITGLISNQIFINMMYAMAMRHLMQEAFPKVVYNADLIPTYNNGIGQAIAVHGLQVGQAINQVAANLNPPDMSNQILTTLDSAIALTKECMGVTDVQLGSVKSENTSAIMVMQQNAEVPLENIRAGMYEFVEETAAIMIDMMATYYGERPVMMDMSMQIPITDQDSGSPVLQQDFGTMMTVNETRRVLRPFDFNRLKNTYLNVRIDVGTSTAYSEIAMTQTLDNMRSNGIIDDIQYIERLPDYLVPMKQKLIDEKRLAQQQMNGVPAGSDIPDSSTLKEIQPIQQQMNTNRGGTSGGKKKGDEPLNNFGASLSDTNAFSQLGSNVQQQYNSLTPKAKRVLSREANLKAGIGN